MRGMYYDKDGTEMALMEWAVKFEDGDHDDYQDRYSTEAQAIAGHERIVNALRKGTAL